jgi:hypothetical protein
MLIKGSPGTEIADFFGINPNTLYERCVKDNGITFTEFSQPFYAKGSYALRHAQYDKALSGDNTMLVWLGKCRLKQKDAALESAATGQIVIKVQNDGLGSGINISAPILPKEDNPSAE